MKLDNETFGKINDISQKLQNFSSDNVEGFKKLRKDVFDVAKFVLLDNNHEGEAYSQLQYFFHGIENNMHSMMASNSVNEGKKQLNAIKTEFKEFNRFFE